MPIDDLIVQLRTFAGTHPDLRAIALVGSHARGDARPGSDIDLVLLTAEPDRYLGDRDWLHAFGTVTTCTREDWGAVQSLRVTYADGTEVEFGLARPAWASANPVDDGTQAVVRDGMVPVFDPDGVLSRLAAAVERRSARGRMGDRLDWFIGAGQGDELADEAQEWLDALPQEPR